MGTNEKKKAAASQQAACRGAPRTKALRLTPSILLSYAYVIISRRSSQPILRKISSAAMQRRPVRRFRRRANRRVHHPPGKGATYKKMSAPLCTHLFGDLAGNRTRDCAVRGRRLNRLTTRPYEFVLRPEPPRRADLPLKPRLLGDYSIFSPILQPFLRMVGQKFFRNKMTSACAANR